MRETRSSGSVEGVMSNRDPYSDLKYLFLTSARKRALFSVLLSVRLHPRRNRSDCQTQNRLRTVSFY
jgi:hypothetical protein